MKYIKGRDIIRICLDTGRVLIIGISNERDNLRISLDIGRDQNIYCFKRGRLLIIEMLYLIMGGISSELFLTLGGVKISTASKGVDFESNLLKAIVQSEFRIVVHSLATNAV